MIETFRRERSVAEEQNASVLLNSRLMRELVHHAGNGMVRVSAKNVTFKRVLCEAVNELRELGVPLLGYVFNLADKKHGRIRQCEREECNREESCCYQKKLIGQKQLKCADEPQ